MTGQEMQRVLLKLKLSQAKFAGRLGVRPSTVSDWANDKGLVPEYAAYALKLLAAIEELKEGTK